MTRTFWLSFVDPARPDGERFLGVCVVDVSRRDAACSRMIVRRNFPHARPGAEWIAAATSIARRHGCNPGGEVLGFDITSIPTRQTASIPRNKLLSRDELEAIDLL
jgi:hypothetical protein